MLSSLYTNYRLFEANVNEKFTFDEVNRRVVWPFKPAHSSSFDELISINYYEIKKCFHLNIFYILKDIWLVYSNSIL